MDAHRFVNALRIMRNIDRFDLNRAGVPDENWGTPEASERDQIADFLRDPFGEAMRMPEANLERLWVLIEARQPKMNTDPTRPADRRVLTDDESPTFGRARAAAQEAARSAMEGDL